ncbi:MAG TPA: helix-hairpin-helix domain-containing protein [Candidatus Kapabacteria bacterium]|jgi:competence ComEA-like helix-hairpin-helix protein
MLTKFRGMTAKGRDRVFASASQLYTPRELRALLLFLLTGIAVLLFRFGKHIYTSWFPEMRNRSEIVQERKSDSLFFALSTAANARDSLFFSLPEDSLNATRAHTVHHSKEEGLALQSVSLNRSTKEDLIRLPSIGEATAELILEYRSERGFFRSLEELKNVRGFGGARFEKVRKYLKLN